ncbi:hypothetical protein [Rhizosaccharibacter radicis]|uniref:Uncharacterized protein n=1 Tax=Rhizosaccharibacter radicis TaxID=2782605 RepID=A0ABT1W144_9PROT|nr:hypothetical protein [Acetobacteraceae bacterium KSS12]
MLPVKLLMFGVLSFGSITPALASGHRFCGGLHTQNETGDLPSISLARAIKPHSIFKVSPECGYDNCGLSDKPHVVAGDLVIVVGPPVEEAGSKVYVCGTHISRTIRDRSNVDFGWLLATDLRRQELPEVPLRLWSGRWHSRSSDIWLWADGDRLKAKGDSVWKGSLSLSPHFGEFTAEAKSVRNVITFETSDDAHSCKVRMVYTGKEVAVIDNDRCGGYNVSFSGVYTRRVRAAK